MLIEHLSDSLILTESFISELADNSCEYYNKFSVPKKSGGTRVVYQPNKELKLLQRVIHDDFLRKLTVHSSCAAYTEGSSVKKNAERHKENNFLLRLDFVDFFKSITHNDILLYLRDNPISEEWDEKDLDLLLKLVCYKGRLTMGAVTSPMISNLVCMHLDKGIENICNQDGIIYSRYADDIYLSTSTPNVLHTIPKKVVSLLRNLEYPKNLIINTTKTLHTSHKRKMIVTGLIITNQGRISIGRNKKREIRSLIHKWDVLSIDQKKYLQGYLSYCVGVEPLFINSLCEKYSSKVIKKIQSYKFTARK